MATYIPKQAIAPTPAPTPVPTPAPAGLVPSNVPGWKPQETYGSAGRAPEGLASVWSGGNLSGSQAIDARQFIADRFPDAFKADGTYDDSDAERNKWVAGGMQAMGIKPDQAARMIGLDPKAASSYVASNAEAISEESSKFQRDNPRLFVRQPVVAPAPYGELKQQYEPQLDRKIDPKTETIEGRLGNVLGRDAAGNYTNETVRQAVERATQQFAKRGLVNTSMAAQAGQEAAIAKAIEIVGPDAERYFQQGRANQDAKNVFARDETLQGYTERNSVAQWDQDKSMQDDRFTQDRLMADIDQRFREGMLSKEQAFNLRQNYVTAQDRVSQSYQRMVDTINTSQMEPEEKTAAIANAAQIRDSESAYINSIFAKQPEWQNDWLALSVQVGATSIESMSDINALAAIANDPAQPAETRTRAQARLAELEANPPPTPSPTPTPAVDYGAA